MIRIYIPNNNLEERKYIIKIFFKYFLGVKYNIYVNENIDKYILSFSNNWNLNIEDHFFYNYKNRLEYLNINNIPLKIEYLSSEFCPENNIPILFGRNKLEFKEKEVNIGIDIFASSFFMLTRWEEYVNGERDNLNKFPAKESIAYKNNILHRPIVNEYCEFLWNIIEYINPLAERTTRKFCLNITHDIDLISKPISIRNFASDIKRFRVDSFRSRLKYLFKKENPYDTFDFLMNKSENLNLESHFYFMTGHNERGKDGENYNNKDLFKKSISKIKERDHIIGFHPSFNSYNDVTIFRKEKELLEQFSLSEMTEGRQHALRFEVPVTWQIWNDCGMKISSNMGYASHEGFRCGTGNKFPVFNILTRELLNVEEKPLILMDTTLNFYRGLTAIQSFEQVKNYILIGKKYNMPITLLFHNSSFDELNWKGWKKSYMEFFDNKTYFI